MKNRIKLFFTAAVMALGAAASAQEQRPISLDEAVNLSVSNSKQLKVSKARIDQALAAVEQAEQKKLPDVGVSASYLRLTNANVDLKTKDPNSGGGTGTGSSPKVSQAMYGILNASVPIYAGGRIRYGIESSRFLARATELDAENEKDEVMQNAVEAYVNLFKARSAVNLVRENLEQARQRVKDLQNLEKNGLLARNDLLKAELQASNIELSLTDAENNWQLANVNMNLMLGLPEKTMLAPDSSLITQSLSVKPLDDYLQTALNNRKDLAALDLRKEAAQTGVKAVRAEYYPSIQASAGYVAADIPKVITITNAANLGVGVSYSLGSLWKTKAKIKEAEARANELSATQQLMNDRVKLEVNRTYLNWLNMQKKIEVYQKAIEQANENFRIVANKYNNSLATTTDVLEADVAQLQARLNYVFAKADAVVAYNELLKASGQIATTK